MYGYKENIIDMELLNVTEHLKCFNYDHSRRPQIEVINYAKDAEAELPIETNEVIFLLEGSIKYTFHHYPEYELKTGEILFLPMGYRCSYFAESDSRAVIFRLYSPVKLCESYFIERLYDPKESCDTGYGQIGKLRVLTINPRIQSFLDGLTDCISDGIKCKHYFDLKTKEFFLLLRAYYPKSDLREFLSLILSRDTAFSEYVRNNRNNFPTVIALAKSMHLTQRQFAFRFKEVFGRTPYGWIKEGKTLTIHHQITATRKPIKQVAMESGFASLAQFTRFCKKELGKTPAELRDEVLYD